jgi:hypothetical protein
MPVLKDQLWHVEAVRHELGGGPCSDYLVRHRDDVWHLAGVAELAAFLADRQVDVARIAVPDTGLPDSEDGCE